MSDWPPRSATGCKHSVTSPCEARATPRGDRTGPFADDTPPNSPFDEWYNHSYTSLVKTAISIPDALFEAADRLARRLGMTRSELYQRAVAAFLERHEAQAVTDVLNELYERHPQSGALDRGVELLQTLSLAEDDW